MGNTVTTSSFGKLPDGKAADLFTITNSAGLTAKLTNYGATITHLLVPDKKGATADVVLGFDSVEPYTGAHPYFGCTVGRVANRIANGRFTLDGKSYQLAVNNGPNALHGGIKGFSRQLWKAEPVRQGVRFTLTSPDGDENYPGKLDVEVAMTLTDANELAIEYTARTDKPTVINLTNHSYFNLAGAGSGDIKQHVLTLHASKYTPVTDVLIPTGEIKPVSGTPLDFTKPTRIGARFDEIKKTPTGYDNNFVVEGGGAKTLVPAAKVLEPGSGRVMETFTTCPGIQLYTANYLDGSIIGKDGKKYDRHCAFCLETQHFPDSIHHPSFPSTVLRPGEVYHEKTIYKFSTAA